MPPLRFVDLFAGLGGFHLGMNSLGHKCVFASELDEDLKNLYQQNFDLTPAGDIRQVCIDDIPSHEVLCGGFPCQPFSKAGEQKGLDCPVSGEPLFRSVIAILRKHKPEYLFLENVANLEKHNSGKTWKKLLGCIRAAGYKVDAKLLSPHQFGIPQIRPRFFIVGCRSGLDHFNWPEPFTELEDLSITSVLDTNPSDARKISTQSSKCLDIWQQFLSLFPKDKELPSFPIWSMEFGANYPFESNTPFSVSPQLLARRKGSHGKNLNEFHRSERFDYLPSYARSEIEKFPKWKIDFIRQNRDLYHDHKQWIDSWMPKILDFPASYQKLEWNCKGEERDIRSFVIQFRASGVRLKRPTTAPSLVAMTTTQVPIIGWEERYMTPKECSRLQSMERLKFLPTSNKAFKALGNAVNATLVELIAERLCRVPIH